MSTKTNRIVDRPGSKQRFRDTLAGEFTGEVPFMEVYVKCGLETCIRRESGRKEGLVMAGLYKKALERKKTGKDFPELGQVVGIDTPYEENDKAEVVIDSEKLSAEEAARVILDKLAQMPKV